MSRYRKYFLQHILYLEDDLCRYYVQDNSWGHHEILDVEYAEFDWDEDALNWLAQCAEYDPSTTMSRLRDLLAEDCLTQYRVHRMNDRQVMRTAADELCMNAWKVVIKPKLGWAVRINTQTRMPEQPILVNTDEDLDGLLAELKVHLDAIVDDRRQQTEQLEAKLAEMNILEKAWKHGKIANKYNPQYWMLKNSIDVLRSGPDAAKAAMKKLKTMGNAFHAAIDAIRHHSIAPINEQVAKAITPLMETAEQVKLAVAMSQVLLDDDDTYELFVDFGNRYIRATHQLDLLEYGGDLARIVVTFIASIAAMFFPGGTGAAGTVGNLLFKASRLKKIAPVIDKLYKTLKCIGDRIRLPKAMRSTSNKVKKVAKKRSKAGVPEVEPPKKIDNNSKKGHDNNSGPMTTTTPEDGYHARTSPEITQSVLDKIDPSRFSRDTRFGKAFYVADKGDVAVAEIAHHGATPTHMIRYKLDLSKAKVLDLTDPAVVKKWGSPGGNNYAKTQAIAKKAQEAGFDAIKFPSQRAGGNNIAIFDKFDEILSPQMVTPVK